MTSRSESFQLKTGQDPFNLATYERPPTDHSKGNLRKSISFLETIRNSISKNPTPMGSRKPSIHYDSISAESLISRDEEHDDHNQ